MAMITDARTKHYCEIQPATEPSDVDYYKNVINTRPQTLANLTPFCRLSTELTSTGWIGYLLQNDVHSRTFYYANDAPVVGKCILQVDFLYDVWVNKWSLAATHNYEWYVVFKWQASHNSKDWVDIGDKTATEKNNITSMMRDENTIEWKFENPEKAKGIKYKYWRAFGVSGQMKSGWLNLLFMNIE